MRGVTAVAIVAMWGLAGGTVAGCADAVSGVTSAVIDKIFEPGDTGIKAVITTSAELNPDYRGRPSPIVIRTYQLRSSTAFMNADFFALYDNEAGELGEELEFREELELEPGQSLDYERVMTEDARFFGVVAAFREYETAEWRAVFEPRPEKNNKITIELDRLAVRIVEPD